MIDNNKSRDDIVGIQFCQSKANAILSFYAAICVGVIKVLLLLLFVPCCVWSTRLTTQVLFGITKPSSLLLLFYKDRPTPHTSPSSVHRNSEWWLKLRFGDHPLTMIMMMMGSWRIRGWDLVARCGGAQRLIHTNRSHYYFVQSPLSVDPPRLNSVRSPPSTRPTNCRDLDRHIISICSP